MYAGVAQARAGHTGGCVVHSRERSEPGRESDPATIAPATMSTFNRLIGFLRPYRRGLIVSIVLAVGSQAAGIALIWVTGRGVIEASDSSTSTHGDR